jgi:glycogen synthase kinase 3 beta
MTLEPVFPGDSSIEQLIEIIKILGTPTHEQLLAYSKENANMEIPKVKGSDWKKILKRYHP